MLAHFKSTVLEKLNRELHQANQPESLQSRGEDATDLGQSGKKNLWQVVEQFKQSIDMYKEKIEEQKERNVKANLQHAITLQRYENQLRT
jgi:hypothetical protein